MTPSAPIPLESLRRLPLLADAPEADLVTLARLTRLDHFAREAVIFTQDDPATRIWIVHTGRVKIVHQDESGREVILEMISPGELFGGAVLFMPFHPATAKAMEEVETLSFSSEAYAHFVSSHMPTALKLIRMLERRLHSMMSLQVMAGERVERRLAHFIAKMADRCGRPEGSGTLITLSLSRQDLADMAGTTLETAIRTMSRFRAQGLVETRRGGYLFIPDLEKLRQQAHPP